jgi:transcription antitermination factor NusG
MLEYMAWYAVQVHTRREKQIEVVLLEKGYDVFLPTYVCKTHSRSEFEAPLFPGYLFCRIVSPHCGKIITTGGVVQILRVGGVPARIDSLEIERIKRIVTSPVVRMPWRYLPAGCRVRIASGPLEGMEGLIENDNNGPKLVVSVNILCRSVAAALDPSTVIVPLFRKTVPLATTDEQRLAQRLASGA